MSRIGHSTPEARNLQASRRAHSDGGPRKNTSDLLRRLHQAVGTTPRAPEVREPLIQPSSAQRLQTPQASPSAENQPPRLGQPENLKDTAPEDVSIPISANGSPPSKRTILETPTHIRNLLQAIKTVQPDLPLDATFESELKLHFERLSAVGLPSLEKNGQRRTFLDNKVSLSELRSLASTLNRNAPLKPSPSLTAQERAKLTKSVIARLANFAQARSSTDKNRLFYNQLGLAVRDGVINLSQAHEFTSQLELSFVNEQKLLAPTDGNEEVDRIPFAIYQGVADRTDAPKKVLDTVAQRCLKACANTMPSKERVFNTSDSPIKASLREFRTATLRLLSSMAGNQRVPQLTLLHMAQLSSSLETIEAQILNTALASNPKVQSWARHEASKFFKNNPLIRADIPNSTPNLQKINPALAAQLHTQVIIPMANGTITAKGL